MFLSKKLSLAEQKYSTTEKKCAAIIFSVQKLKCYLDGHQKFVIQTDHNPLVWLEQAERDAAHRAAETPERSQARRRRQEEYLVSQRAAETPEQSQARRLQHATYMASQRDTETIEAAESRKRAVAERAQQRRLIFTKNTWGVFDKAAFEYDETLDYESLKLIKVEAMNKECRFCCALKWKEESAGMCCLGGE
ncbi:uncharacterized protein TNCV_577441 [Trichonephila clavipes]|nr:uncharacterized protein TNCV_577441 [Trichonephila clavipes]